MIYAQREVVVIDTYSYIWGSVSLLKWGDHVI